MFSKIFKNILEAESLYISRCMFPNVSISGTVTYVPFHMRLNSLLNFFSKKLLFSCDCVHRGWNNWYLLLGKSVKFTGFFLKKIDIFLSQVFVKLL